MMKSVGLRAVLPLFALLAACNNEPTASEPLAGESGRLANRTASAGKRVRVQAKASSVLFDRDGRVLRAQTEQWGERAGMAHGVARAGQSSRQLLRVGANAESGAPALRGLAAVLAVAGGPTPNGILGGTSESRTDGQGNVVRVVSERATDGGPTRLIRVFFNGVLATSVTFDWQRIEGGYVLQQQVATAFSAGRIVAKAVVDITLDAIEEPGALEVAASAFDGIVSMLLPEPLYASCLGNALQTIGGFAGLVLGAGAIAAAQAAPIAGQITGAIAGAAWVSGWVAWTGSLIETAEACSQ